MALPTCPTPKAQWVPERRDIVPRLSRAPQCSIAEMDARFDTRAEHNAGGEGHCGADWNAGDERDQDGVRQVRDQGSASVAQRMAACATSVCTAFARTGMEVPGWDIRECDHAPVFQGRTEVVRVVTSEGVHGMMAEDGKEEVGRKGVVHPKMCSLKQLKVYLESSCNRWWLKSSLDMAALTA
jgi:hypothetical protein